MWYDNVEKDERTAIRDKMILFLGDSLTRGSVGFTYIRFMAASRHKNRGKNGDSAWGALQRLKRYRKRRWYGEVDVCVVAIGTNDLLRPFLCRTSRGFRLLFSRKVKRYRCAGEPTGSGEPGSFEEHVRELLRTLREDGKRVIVAGLPKIQIAGYPTDLLHEYNAILEDLARESFSDFADILGAQERACPDCRCDFNWGQTCIPRGLDILTMGLLPFTKEWFSKARKLEFTVDGIHFNRFSAQLLAGELDKLLTEEERS